MQLIKMAVTRNLILISLTVPMILASACSTTIEQTATTTSVPPTSTVPLPTPSLPTSAPDTSDADTSEDASDIYEDVEMMLSDLVIANEQPNGYDRNLFGGWKDFDGNGCDTRREVLIAEAEQPPIVGDDCKLSGGVWVSRYDAVTTTNSSEFDIDHMVPLAEAWQSGANTWTEDQRRMYSNDLDYEHALIAVSSRSNRSKGARDLGEWLPPSESEHCWYAEAWVTVKIKWNLTVDVVEHDALRDILNNCPRQTTVAPGR